MERLLVALIAATVIVSGCIDTEEDPIEDPIEEPEDPIDDINETEEDLNETEEPTENETETNGEDTTDENETETNETEDTGTEDEPRQIEISGFVDNSYDVEELDVEAGETVEFVYNHEGGQHDLVLEDSEGEIVERTDILSESGESDSFTYTFQEDSEDYQFFCSVGSHRAQGMEGTITVE